VVVFAMINAFASESNCNEGNKTLTVVAETPLID